MRARVPGATLLYMRKRALTRPVSQRRQCHPNLQHKHCQRQYATPEMWYPVEMGETNHTVIIRIGAKNRSSEV